MTTEEITKIYESLLEKEAAMKALDREVRSLKASITEYHNGEPVMQVGDYESKLVSCTRMTLLEKQVQERYHIEFDNDDYKVTPYQRLTVKKIA